MPKPKNTRTVTARQPNTTVVTMKDLAVRKQELQVKRKALRAARGTKTSDRI